MLQVSVRNSNFESGYCVSCIGEHVITYNGLANMFISSEKLPFHAGFFPLLSTKHCQSRKNLKGLFHPAFLARVVSSSSFVVS